MTRQLTEEECWQQCERPGISMDNLLWYLNDKEKHPERYSKHSAAQWHLEAWAHNLRVRVLEVAESVEF